MGPWSNKMEENIMMNIPKLSDLNDSNCTERSIMSHYPEFHDYILKTYPDPDLKWTERLYMYYHRVSERPRCRVCGSKVRFISLSKGWGEYCGKRCMGKDEKIKEKKRMTSLSRFGVENPLGLQSVKDKRRETVREKYGVDNVFQSEEVKEKIRETCIEKYGVSHHNKTIERKESISEELRNHRLQEDKNIIGYTKEGRLICKCNNIKCNKCNEIYYIISSHIYYDRKRLGYETCTKLLKEGKIRTKNTTIEIFIKNILDEYGIKYECNNRSIIRPKELDIYIPSKNIAIECNGIWSHSSLSVPNPKPPKYHINKTVMCREKGVRLIHIWEDWVRWKSDIVRSMLINRLGLCERKIGARECVVREVDSKTCNKFLDDNHIQGRGSASVHLGLYRGEELVSVMTFGRGRVGIGNGIKRDGEWELIRFCSLRGCVVRGGADKLLKHFISAYDPIRIISFSSNDISDGGLYEKLGFVSDRRITASYWYINPETMERYHRSAFTKRGIVRRGWREAVDRSWTEESVMAERGWWKIWDSGQMRWVWEK